jgi:hypothetical protein
MHWSEVNDLNRKMLRRTVALLLALAGLAERASTRNAVLCWSVLWLLRPGEAIARDHIAGLTRNPALACPTIHPRASSAADALRLAETFRMLAALLAAFAAALPEIGPAHSTNPHSVGWPVNLLTILRGPMSTVEHRDSS